MLPDGAYVIATMFFATGELFNPISNLKKSSPVLEVKANHATDRN